MHIIHKIVCAILCLLLIAFAVLQFNDPDPLVWIAVYGAAATICFFAFLEKFNKMVLMIAMVGFLSGAIMLFPGEFKGLSLSHGYSSSIEEAREALGLVICFLVSAYLWILSGKVKP